MLSNNLYCRPWRVQMYGWSVYRAHLSTRAASASNSSRAKQALVRILFGSSAEPGLETHQQLDHSMYTYYDLRDAYLKKVQALHPDKHDRDFLTEKDRQAAKRRFLEVMEAWNRYEELAKLMKRVSKGDSMKSNFTMFGVGCSFSDSEAEKQLRSEIMDQAGRGWFSAGELGTGEVGAPSQRIAQRTSSNLVDESWFLSEDDKNNGTGDRPLNNRKKHATKSLVEFIPHYRK